MRSDHLQAADQDRLRAGPPLDSQKGTGGTHLASREACVRTGRTPSSSSPASTSPPGRAGFGPLLLGYDEHDRLRYAGKVGTGWSTAARRELRARLDMLVAS